ncbi:hypothetical protein [Gulosibacter faecalis]|jgi:hypothetical protein|uniref:Tryptophan-rich sensory protein n=1 Tax=Gulosibacter faecalis TaxID=272240 RepID=A0ABW5UU18_9MICO|nr:hypothetical protein [Gulosibacter faecalis]
MALRSSSPAAASTPEAADESLGQSQSQRVRPDTPEKRWSALIAAALIVVSMFLPWWLTTYPIRNDADFLTGWQLLGLGLGFGDWASQTNFSAFGNVLWGVVPTVAGLLLAVLLVVRATRPRAIPAPNIALWAVFSLLCQLWLVALGWARLNASFGEFPTLWGMLPSTMAAVYSAVTLMNWWRRGEKGLWPARGRRRAAASDAEMDSLFGIDSSEADTVARDKPLVVDDEVVADAGAADETTDDASANESAASDDSRRE